MPPFVGRQTELQTLNAALIDASTASHSITIALEGPSGIGKSALLEAFLAGLPGGTTFARLPAQRLERVIDGSFAARLPQEAAVLAIDNAQWIDRQSRTALARLASQSAHPLMIVAASDEPFALDVPGRRTLKLQPLETADAQALVRAGAPRASRKSVETIAERAQGVPFELVTLAWASAQDAEPGISAGRAIAKFLSGLPVDARTFVQTLSVLDSPASDALVAALFSDRVALLAALDMLAPALLSVHPSGITFAHALTATAVRETIAMKIPLHRRIVGALERVGVETPIERMMLAEQSLHSGDRATAQRATLELALYASNRKLFEAAAWASERHLEGGEPSDERFIAFYAHFLTALMEADDCERAEAIASHALSEAQRRELNGIGVLAGRLVEAQWHGGRQDAARASFQRYAQTLASPDDGRALREAAPWLSA